MKKTITVHIANSIFNIEEEAYQKLKDYLSKISQQFPEKEERDEIMFDIEIRIAELFKETLSLSKEVVIDQDVNKMISIMGSPKDFIVEEEDNEAEFESNKYDSKKDSKQIYRDDKNALLGGVCSGLAAYFGLDPIVVRILFIVVTLMGGSGILIYLILYFAIPEAKTIAEKLRMKGEKIDVSSIKNQFEKVKNDLNLDDNKRKAKILFNQVISFLVKVFSKFIHFFSKLVGLSLLIIGIIGLIVLVLFFNKELFSLITEKSFSIYDMVGLIFNTTAHQKIVYYSLLLSVLLPMCYFLSLGMQLVFKVKKVATPVKILFLTCWIFSLVVLAMAGNYFARNFNEKSDPVITKYILKIDDKSPLVIQKNVSSSSQVLLKSKEDVELTAPFHYTEEATYFAFPGFEILPSETDSFSLEIVRWSKGIKKSEAVELANAIKYHIEILENELLLSSYFFIPASAKYRGQKVKVVLKVPEGRKIKLGKEVDHITYSLKKNGTLNNSTWINRKGKMINAVE